MAKIPNTTEVVLVSMPFGSLFQPSLGLSLLKAAITDPGITTEILYFTLSFANLIGAPVYAQILSEGGRPTYDLVGEWIFSSALFDSASLDPDGYLNDVLRGHSSAHSFGKPASEEFIHSVLDARKKTGVFLDSCLQDIISRNPRIVGFTSTFQQQIASLALAKRIKAQSPEIFIIFGGANCEGVMGFETIHQFPFVDAVVSGEGDCVFPELVQRVLSGQPISELQGVYTRQNLETVCRNGQYPNAPLVHNMDTLPFPNYDDFFEQFVASGLANYHPPMLLFESSRGCWWGEKMHCTFCGLNGAAIGYRSKSAQHALDELVHLTTRYPNCNVSSVDNILNMNYFKDFIPGLISRQLCLELFYEVKANLRKEQVRLIRQAGITQIQPGIESLSTEVLKLMHKGVSGLQNIQLLKWCKEIGVRPYWNMLWGFPREPREEYVRMANLLPLLMHMQPPVTGTTMRLDRFSPSFDSANELGFVDVAPYPSYFYVYPFQPEVVINLAYYFTFSYKEPQNLTQYIGSIIEQIAAWRANYETSDLFSVDKDTYLLVWDLRPIARRPLTILSGLQKFLYITCDQIRTIYQLQRLLQEQVSVILTKPEIEELLLPLIEDGLMVKEGNAFLTLAIPIGQYSPSGQVMERLLAIAGTIGTSSNGGIVIPLSGKVEEEVIA